MEEKFKNVLKQFEKSKAWADIVSWLNKVLECLKGIPGKIPQEDVLAKRLSQCLNHSLPSAVHLLALDNYDYILANYLAKHLALDQPKADSHQFALGDAIALYSPGLFQFYQFAKLEVKTRLNEIIRAIYLKLGPEVLTCLNGLITILLFGLDDQNEAMLKELEEILQALETNIGTKYFYGALWLAITRTSKIRLPALKYLLKMLPMDLENYPIKKVVFNSYVFKISNYEEGKEDMQIERIDSERPISHDEVLKYYYPQKSTLVMIALINSLKDDNMLTQSSALDLLVSRMPLKGDMLKSDEKIKIIETACHLLLKKNDRVTRRIYSYVMGHIKDPSMLGSGDGSFAGNPIELVNFKTDICLKYFLKALEILLAKVPQATNEAIEPLKIIGTIFMDNEFIADKLLEGISIPLINYLQKYQSSTEFGADVLKVGSNMFSNERFLIVIWQALGSELSELIGEQNHKKVLEAINLIQFFLKIAQPNEEELRGRESPAKYLKPILARILISMGSLFNNFENTESIISPLLLIQQISIMLEKGGPIESFGGMSESVKKFVVYYADLLKYLLQSKLSAISPDLKEALSLATQTAVHLQKYIDIPKESPEWLQKIFECIDSMKEQTEIVLICIDGYISICEKAVGPANVEIYQFLKGCLQEQKGKIIARLWDLIGVSPNDRMVVELIVRADKLMKETLTVCVEDELSVPDVNAKVAAINRFSLFWKLSGEYYPSFIPFEGAPNCLFNVISMVGHSHPLVRHSSKNWFEESKKRFDRMLDPSMAHFFGSMKFKYITATGQIIIAEDYDTGIARDAFDRMRTIVNTSKPEVIKYLRETKIANKDLQMNYSSERAIIQFKEFPVDPTYLELLLFLSLKFICGQVAKELENTKFASDNATVNACACEFLELLLTSLQPQEAGPEVASLIIDYLIIGLHNAFENKDSIMQVEILKLIKVVQNKCAAKTKVYAENCVRIFSAPFYPIILEKGLGSSISFVRASYIGYVRDSLPLFLYYMGNQLEDRLGLILATMSKNLSLCTISVRAGEEKMITSENDIFTILNGIKSVLNYICFSSDSDLDTKSESYELRNKIDALKSVKLPALLDRARETVIEHIGKLLLNSMKLWKKPNPKLIKDFKLSSAGILPYTEKDYADTIQMYNKETTKDNPEGFTFDKLKKNLSIFQEGIVSLIKPIMKAYSNQTIKSIIDAWVGAHSAKKDDMLKKLLDIVIFLEPSLEQVLQGAEYYLEESYSEEECKKKNKVSPKKGKFEYRNDIALEESVVCLFVYSYALVTYEWYNVKSNDTADERVKSLKSKWTAFAGLAKKLLENRYLTTYCWGIDIMYILAIKFDPREMTTNERSQKRKIEEIASALSLETATMAILPSAPNNPSLFSLEVPLNPSVYGLMSKTTILEEEKKGLIKENEMKNAILKKLIPQLDEALMSGPKKQEMGAKLTCILPAWNYHYLRGFCFLTLQNTIYDLLYRLLNAVSRDRMNTIMESVMEKLYPFILKQDECFMESAIDVFLNFLKSKDEYKIFLKPLHEILFMDKFFAVSQRCLKKWKQIYRWFLEIDKNKLMTHLLTLLTPKTLSLISAAEEEEQKFQALKRITFLLLSGEKDHFSELYSTILGKWMEGIRDSERPNIAGQYLMLLRAMLLKFSQLSECSKETPKNLQTLWPNLLYKLFKLFRMKGDLTKKRADDPHPILPLFVEGFKVIETMINLNTEDFSLSLWVFLVDTFNIYSKPETDVKKKEIEDYERFRRFQPICYSILDSVAYPVSFVYGDDNVEEKSSSTGLRIFFDQQVCSVDKLSLAITNYTIYLSARNVNMTDQGYEQITEEQLEKDFVHPFIEQLDTSQQY